MSEGEEKLTSKIENTWETVKLTVQSFCFHSNFHSLISWYLKMTYFILPNEDIYQFWVKKNLGGIFGAPNAQKCGKIPLFSVLTPKNQPPQKVSPKIDTFSFLTVCLV